MTNNQELGGTFLGGVIISVAQGSCHLSARQLGSYAAPSAPRSRPPAATLSGGLRPGSLRVHAPCIDDRHRARLGVPGRRQPRGPAASGDVARGLQVLPKNKITFPLSTLSTRLSTPPSPRCTLHAPLSPPRPPLLTIRFCSECPISGQSLTAYGQGHHGACSDKDT